MRYAKCVPCFKYCPLFNTPEFHKVAFLSYFSDRDTPKDDFDEETWMKLASNYDPSLIPDYTDHDCKTIRQFEAGKLVPEYLNRNRMKKWEKKGNEKKKVFDNDSKWKDDIVKYNYAYGIPIVGQTHFTDESLKRACYLVR